ncbi:MAG: DUF2236 domain-containing protein [Bacteroidetes bacterium]|nr:DUF2236 domain-containing protein [Bacteroidota bacterium]
MKSWNDKLMDEMRARSDQMADHVLAMMLKTGDTNQFQLLMGMEINEDPIPEKMISELQNYCLQLQQLPSWAEPKKIDLAEDFFQEYQAYVYSALLFASLPFCYAAADGAKVLYQSNRMQDNTGKRLSETGQFIMDVSEKGAFSPKGKGFKSIIKVRLIHAAVSHRLKESGNWNKEWGTPVNMEDRAGTNLAFSLVTLKAIERMGVRLDKKTKDAVIHKWNIISWLGGLDEKLLAYDYEEALLLEKQIIRRLFSISEEGSQLTRSLLAFIHEIEHPFAKDYGAHMIRYLLGNQIGDLLRLPELSLLNWPSLLSSLNAIVSRMGWSPREQNIPIPLQLAMIKRGEVQNQRMDYPLQEILEKSGRK